MKDLRSFINDCEKKLPREFVRVTKEVDPKYEISAVIKKPDLMGKHPLVFFQMAKGSEMPVVCNTDTNAAKFGLAFFTKYHQGAKRHPVRFKAITHRKNPIIHDMGAWVNAMPRMMTRVPQDGFMVRKLREAVPDVTQYRSWGGFYGFIQNRSRGRPRIGRTRGKRPETGILKGTFSEEQGRRE